MGLRYMSRKVKAKGSVSVNGRKMADIESISIDTKESRNIHEIGDLSEGEGIFEMQYLGKFPPTELNVKIVRPKHKTPRSLFNAIFDAIPNDPDKSSFYMIASTSVNLNAQNSKNFNDRDVAIMQLIGLAKQYGIKVDLP